MKETAILIQVSYTDAVDGERELRVTRESAAHLLNELSEALRWQVRAAMEPTDTAEGQ